jgi:hypothetical protein
MKRAKGATLLVCLFVVYCVLLSQGLKASAASAFFGALAAVPLTVHIYRRLWPLPIDRDGGEGGLHRRARRDAAEAPCAPDKIDRRIGHTD